MRHPNATMTVITETRGVTGVAVVDGTYAWYPIHALYIRIALVILAEVIVSWETFVVDEVNYVLFNLHRPRSVNVLDEARYAVVVRNKVKVVGVTN